MSSNRLQYSCWISQSSTRVSVLFGNVVPHSSNQFTNGLNARQLFYPRTSFYTHVLIDFFTAGRHPGAAWDRRVDDS